MTRPGTMTRAGSILAVRHAMAMSSSGWRRWRGGLVAAVAGLGGARCGRRRSGSGSPALMPGFAARRRRSRRARWSGSKGAVGPSRRWWPTVMTVPSGASKASSVNPAAANSARMAGVRSGGRRCRVQTTWPPGTQNPGIAWMVRVMSAALMFPNTPHTRTMSAGTSSAYQRHCDASPSTIRIRSATPAPAAAARSRAKATRAGSSSTSSAETSGPLGWVATTSITSRPWPAHRLTIRIGSGWVSGARPAGISSSAARTIDCTVRSRSERFEDGSS